MLDVEGFILVGGASSRMRTDKAQLEMDGQPNIKRIARELNSLTTSVRTVGAPETLYDLPSVRDLNPHWGPLGGIQSALASCQADWALIVACDLPFVTGALFRRLAKFAADNSEAFDAVVPMQPDKRPQPLCTLYRRHTCFAAVEVLIARGEHTPRALFERVQTRYVDFEELVDLRWAQYFFFNINTPENFDEAKRIVGISDDPV